MPKKNFDPVQYQLDFLTTLARLDERVEDGKRRADVDRGFTKKIALQAVKPLEEMRKARLQALVRCKEGYGGHKPESMQEGVKKRCRLDVIYWFNNWAWIFNPWLTRLSQFIGQTFPSKIPFVLFPKAEEYIRWREDLYMRGRIGVVYKCREVGVSWDNCGHQVWKWLFEPGFQGRFGSRKEGMVDSKGSPDSLFWKCRFLIYNCPSWMRPPGWETKNNKFDTILKLVNEEHRDITGKMAGGAVISGEGGDKIGIGGRGSMFDCDEWAKVEHAKAIEANLSANCPCRIYTSTPEGMDNDYADKYHSGKIPIFDFAWHHDPRKTKDWLENFKESHSKAVFEQEVMRSFNAFNIGLAVPNEWVAASIELFERIKNGIVDYPSDKERIGALDVAAGGDNRTVIGWREGIIVQDCEEWDLDNSTVIAQKAGTMGEQLGIEALNYDVIAVGFGVKSTFDLSEFSFEAVPVDARGAASETPIEGDSRPARERCRNRRAELVMRVRRRFEMTYEYIEKGIAHPIDKLIAICNHPKLRTQLSVPELHCENGKWYLESKEQMRKRGVESPDFFDMCMLLFADEHKQKRVISSLKKQNIQDDFFVYWGSVNPATTANHYVAVQHDKTLVAAGLGAVWWFGAKKLQIYDEFQISNPGIQDVVSQIQARFSNSAKVYEYLANREFFGSKDDQDSLFMQYLPYITFYENFQYNEMSALAQIEQMMKFGQIEIHKRCKKLVMQLTEWDRRKGVPDKNNKALAFALCTIVNRLDEGGYISIGKKEQPRRPYHPVKSDEGKTKEKWLTYT